jgi:isocitrate lyase
VGTGYFDLVMLAASAGAVSTAALSGFTDVTQFEPVG